MNLVYFIGRNAHPNAKGAGAYLPVNEERRLTAMQPRPMFPLQGGMRPPGQAMFGGGAPMMRPGAGMFGGGSPMMGGSRPGLFGGGGRPMMGQGANPFSGMMGGQQMGRGGGLLSRLFGRGNPMGGMGRMMGGPGGMMGAAGRAAGGGGGLLQSFSNPGGLMSMLNNTQQLIKTAQTVAPMIQQYGPLVRSLPGLWKLYRGLKDSDDSETKKEPSTKKAVAPEESSERERPSKAKSTGKSTSQTTKRRTDRKQNTTSQKPKRERGSSVPKLYI